MISVAEDQIHHPSYRDHEKQQNQGRRQAGRGSARVDWRAKGLHDELEMGRGPRMYEMQGPRSALPRLASRLLDCPALPGRPPLPDTRPKFRSPGSPAVLGVAPGIGIRLWW